jgi:hypothetical protein
LNNLSNPARNGPAPKPILSAHQTELSLFSDIDMAFSLLPK